MAEILGVVAFDKPHWIDQTKPLTSQGHRLAGLTSELFTNGREIFPRVSAPTLECPITFAVIESKLFVNFIERLDDAPGHFNHTVRFTAQVGDDGQVARLRHSVSICFHFPDQPSGSRLDPSLNEMGALCRDIFSITEMPNIISLEAWSVLFRPG